KPYTVTVVFENGAVYEIANHPCQENHKGIDHTLYQGKGDHVAIGNVGNFVAQHGSNFFFGHAFEQTGRNGNQRVVFECACSKGVGGSFVDGHFGVTNAGTVGQLVNGVNQPALASISGRLRVDDTGPSAAF